MGSDKIFPNLSLSIANGTSISIICIIILILSRSKYPNDVNFQYSFSICQTFTVAHLDTVKGTWQKWFHSLGLANNTGTLPDNHNIN